jgi:hypothetical protein
MSCFSCFKPLKKKAPSKRAESRQVRVVNTASQTRNLVRIIGDVLPLLAEKINSYGVLIGSHVGIKTKQS